MSQDFQCLLVGCSWVAHWMSQPPDGFDVLCKDFNARIYHCFNVRQHSEKIGGERFNCRFRVLLLDLAHAGGVLPCPAVGQVIPIDRGKNHIFKVHQLHRPCGISRLFRV